MATTYDLVCHPSTPTRSVAGVQVTVRREAGDRIGFDYNLIGNRGVTLKPRGRDTPRRRDELWQDTCFEAFLMPGDGPEYAEFNFTSSEDWAAYGFVGRREGMEQLDVPPPIYWYESGPADVRALIDLHATGMFAFSPAMRLGLSAVVVDRRGVRSFWALAHHSERPDFHDPACFTATLGSSRAA